MPRASPVPADEQPTSSRYRLLYKIASGGAGTVYVGRRIGVEGFSRLVAIKRANPELVGDAQARQMLVREATVASRIHHAHVVAVHDIEVAGDDLLLIMDYVAGATLAELLDAGEPLAPRLAVRIALDTCNGLRAVHELCDDDGIPFGAVHRDISPENVLVGFDGSVRITDFGLARLAHTSYASATGLFAGKLAYVAPEILDGGSFGAQSDLFALGVVVWETLTGKRLFRGDDEKDTSRRVRTMPAPAITEAATGLPAALDPILARALEKPSRSRYESVAAFAEALEAVARQNDLIATDSELGAHVRSVLGADERGALSRGRVSAKAGRPAVDFTFAETASMAHAVGELDDAPTALHVARRPTPTTTWRASPAPLEAPPPPSEPPRAAPAQSEKLRPWWAAVLAAALVGVLGAAAILRWAGRPPPEVAPVATAPLAEVRPAPPAPQPSATVEPPAAESPSDGIEVEVDPAAPTGAGRATRPAAPARDRAVDPTALPANPYRKKL